MYYIGIDLGGTNIKGAAVSPGGNVLWEGSRPTHSELGPEHVADEIAALIRDLDAKGSPENAAGVGLGCPGTVDPDAGIVRYANNLHWDLFDLRKALKQRTGYSVQLANDANAAALGEVAAGCAKDAESAVILTLGTGLGSGVVLGGKLLTGYSGAAAELGHSVIVDNGWPCTCGRRGCLEAYASATGLIRMTREAMEAHPESLLHELAAEQGTVDGQTAFLAKAQGDDTAAQVVRTYIHYLSLGIANIINCFYPQIVALSGGIAKQGDNLLVPLREEVASQVYGYRYLEKPTELICCSLGYQAGIIGAAMLAKLPKSF